MQGKGAINLAAFKIHASVHEARPDVVCAAHSHGMHGKTFSCLGQLLDPITQDSCAFFEDHAIFDGYSGVVYDDSEGKRIAETLGTKKACILQNHGLLTVGETVDATIWWFISMERCCQSQLMAQAAGKPILINEEVAKLTRSQVRREKKFFFFSLFFLFMKLDWKSLRWIFQFSTILRQNCQKASRSPELDQ